MMTKAAAKAKARAILLSGDVLTAQDVASMLSAQHGSNTIEGSDIFRIVDGVIQGMSKAGEIRKERKGRSFVWEAV